MPLVSMLTPMEIDQILAYRSQGFGCKKIAPQIHRSLAVIRNCLTNPDAYGRKKGSGRRKRLSSREKRNILRSASNSDMSLAQIRSGYQLQVSKPTIWRVICCFTQKMKLGTYQIQCLQAETALSACIIQTQRNNVFADQRELANG